LVLVLGWAFTRSRTREEAGGGAGNGRMPSPPVSMVAILMALRKAYNVSAFAVMLQLETLLDDKGAVATFWLVAVISFSAT
jgi:hypothetical protein